MDTFTKSVLLLFVLLNPFILSVYLRDVVAGLGFWRLAGHLVRGGLISLGVFLAFAWAGDAVFEDVLQVRFSSFLIFGGVTFLLIGIRLIVGVGPPVEALRADSDRISGGIAMPLMVGPGTISASVLAGSRLPRVEAGVAIAIALFLAVAAILVFKALHDWVRSRNEALVRRYTEVAGRATALFTGSFAVEMILNGLEGWLRATGF